MDQASLKQMLADALEPGNGLYALLIRAGRSTISECDAPFLTRYKIYRVYHFDEYRRIIVYLAYAPGEPARPLTSNPASLGALLQADGSRIDSLEMAIAYAQNFLDALTGPKRLYLRVNSVDDITFQPDDAGAIPVVAALKERLRKQISPPFARKLPGNAGYRVTLYAMNEHVLERHTMIVKADGEISHRIEEIDEM
jgi:hypothetical protein